MIYRLASPLRRLFPLVPLAAAGFMCGAAAPSETTVMPVQVANAGLFPPPSYEAPVTPETVSKQPAYVPAPVPDPDADAPSSGAGPRGASLTPALFSHKAEFAGDGYAVDSDADHGLDKRRTPAAGLNWSVPVK